MELLSIFIEGKPAAKGSMRAVSTPRGPRVISGSPALAEWAAAVRHAIESHRTDVWPTSSAVCVDLTYCLPRPKYHYRADGRLKSRYSSEPHTKKPDLDKLVRAVLDAITGILILDDSQVVALSARKIYDSRTGCHITIRTLTHEDTTDGHQTDNDRRK